MKLGIIDKTKMKGLIFLVLIFAYSTSASVYVGMEIAAINESINSIATPNGFYVFNFNLPQPFFNISIGFSNYGLFEIKDINFNISLHIFYEMMNNQTVNNNFFTKEVYIKSLSGLSKLNYTVESTLDDFNTTVLDKFWGDIGNSTIVIFLMDLSIECKFYNGLIPFNLHSKDIDLILLDCPTCP